jgi:hypothetical protein
MFAIEPRTFPVKYVDNLLLQKILQSQLKDGSEWTMKQRIYLFLDCLETLLRDYVDIQQNHLLRNKEQTCLNRSMPLLVHFLFSERLPHGDSSFARPLASFKLLTDIDCLGRATEEEFESDAEVEFGWRLWLLTIGCFSLAGPLF